MNTDCSKKAFSHIKVIFYIKLLLGSSVLGVGWDLPFGLTLDARYNLGLSKINAGTNNVETKNQVFQISAGFKIIKLGK